MKNAWIWLIAAVVVIGGGYWYWQSTQVPAMSDDGTPVATDQMEDMNATGSTASSSDTGTSVDVTTGSAPLTSATVTYNGNGFSPSTVTIVKGGSVKFLSTAGDMWVASNPHPEHTGYDGTTREVHCAAGFTGAAPFDQCSPGTSFTFTFNKTGSWGYHDHLNPGLGGTVVVQ